MFSSHPPWLFFHESFNSKIRSLKNWQKPLISFRALFFADQMSVIAYESRLSCSQMNWLSTKSWPKISRFNLRICKVKSSRRSLNWTNWSKRMSICQKNFPFIKMRYPQRKILKDLSVRKIVTRSEAWKMKSNRWSTVWRKVNQSLKLFRYVWYSIFFFILNILISFLLF